MKKSGITALYNDKRQRRRSVSIVLLILFVSLFPLVALAEEQVYFYHNDHLGSPMAITDASGNVVWKADYGSSN